MNHGMTREQQKKLLLAEGALLRFECVQARRAIEDEVGSIAHAGPAGMLRAVSGRSVLSLLMAALPLVLGAGRVARLLKRGRQIAHDTDAYVHEHPWRAIGIAGAVGVLVGMLIARR